MAVASALRIARYFNRDSAAPALPLEGFFVLAHEFSVSLGVCRDIARAVCRGNGRGWFWMCLAGHRVLLTTTGIRAERVAFCLRLTR